MAARTLLAALALCLAAASAPSRAIEPAWVQARLEEALRRSMPWPLEAAALADWDLPPPFAVPPGATRLLVHFRPGEDFLGRVTAELEFLDLGDAAARRVRRAASVEVAVRLPVVVMRGAARRGDVLAAGALALETRDLRQMPTGVLTETATAVGQRLARNLAAGQVLTRAALDLEPVVERGQNVLVEAGADGLEVRLDARALERGAPGQWIALENPVTRRRFQAEVTGPGSARLGSPAAGSPR
jgi:flagella basal body P-ring formation protein FlgA